MLEQILAFLIANWSFIAVAFILGLIGEAIKSIVIGDDKEKAKKTRWKEWFIKTMPLHPVVAGALFGLVLIAVAPEAVAATGIVGSMLYYAASGGLSTCFYMTLKSLAPKATKALQKKLTDTIANGTKSGGKNNADSSSEEESE